VHCVEYIQGQKPKMKRGAALRREAPSLTRGRRKKFREKGWVAERGKGVWSTFVKGGGGEKKCLGGCACREQLDGERDAVGDLQRGTRDSGKKKGQSLERKR